MAKVTVSLYTVERWANKQGWLLLWEDNENTQVRFLLPTGETRMYKQEGDGWLVRLEEP